MAEPFLVARGAGPLAEDPGGQALGKLEARRVVQERQSLERGVGTEAARTSLHAAWSVKRGQKWMRCRPPEVCIKPAAITVGARIGLPWPLHLTQGHDAAGLGWEDARPPDNRRQEAAGGQRRVADQLGVKAQTALPPEQTVIGIDGLPFGAWSRSLAVGRRADDQAVNCLRAPRLIHELAGQPVEQLGMTRGRSLCAEVVVGFDQAAAESTLARSGSPRPAP